MTLAIIASTAGLRSSKSGATSSESRRPQLAVQLPERGILAADDRKVAGADVAEPSDVRRGQAAFTGIIVPFASGAFGSVMVTTPSLNAAATLPASTAAGRRTAR